LIDREEKDLLFNFDEAVWVLFNDDDNDDDAARSCAGLVILAIYGSDRID
jgi:hypothetical protein